MDELNTPAVAGTEPVETHEDDNAEPTTYWDPDEDQDTPEADSKGVMVSLSPSGDFGGSVSRLKKFYERFGFLPNKGKTADYSISESMYRPETSPPRLADK